VAEPRHVREPVDGVEQALDHALSSSWSICGDEGADLVEIEERLGSEPAAA